MSARTPPVHSPRPWRTPSDHGAPVGLLSGMNRADLRTWLQQAALDVARLAEPSRPPSGTPAGRHRPAAIWSEAGIELSEASLWWAAGCPDPATAGELRTAGVRPEHLIDTDGLPKLVDALSATPIALAVAEGFITPQQAAALVSGRSLLRRDASQRRPRRQETDR